jgi:hypothetical protein
LCLSVTRDWLALLAVLSVGNHWSSENCCRILVDLSRSGSYRW